jgi:hypothetical protein
MDQELVWLLGLIKMFQYNLMIKSNNSNNKKNYQKFHIIKKFMELMNNFNNQFKILFHKLNNNKKMKNKKMNNKMNNKIYHYKNK